MQKAHGPGFSKNVRNTKAIKSYKTDLEDFYKKL